LETLHGRLRCSGRQSARAVPDRLQCGPSGNGPPAVRVPLHVFWVLRPELKAWCQARRRGWHAAPLPRRPRAHRATGGPGRTWSWCKRRLWQELLCALETRALLAMRAHLRSSPERSDSRHTPSPPPAPCCRPALTERPRARCVPCSAAESSAGRCRSRLRDRPACPTRTCGLCGSKTRLGAAGAAATPALASC
jgi:hypothetical protein